MDEFTPCDACGSRAYAHVIIDVDDLPLSFCRHHWNAHREALRAYTIHEVDMTHILTEASK